MIKVNKRVVALISLTLMILSFLFFPVSIHKEVELDGHIKKPPIKIEINQQKLQNIQQEAVQSQLDKIHSHNDNIKHNGKKVIFTISFYRALPEENGGYAGLNCLGQNLQYGMVATNYWKLGREIYLPEFDDSITFKVANRGGKDFYCCNRIDIFVSQRQGESDKEYKHRVWNMSIKQVEGYIL